MTLYSFNGRYPDILPNRIRLSNGLTKTDKTTFTDSDLLDAIANEKELSKDNDDKLKSILDDLVGKFASN